ncbi:hypothetical protein [Agrococcus casei]|uniref:Uncharacterized protein n=1 Tax=Agrococcus casei LMG 22410 TaxID=1255656 RepID=A0A1R4GFF5_9MICO|nr:hypothetical protein [Agrococcus casei]SJM66785.1 hypothetical protein CZ674_11460 [Agrococcus casei LMG 22410]
MNKNLMYLTIGAIVLVGLIGSIILQIVRPESLGTFVQQVVIIVGLLISAAGTIYGLGQVNDKIDKVDKQTNGRLEQLQGDRDRAATELAKTREILAAKTGTIPVQHSEEEDASRNA